MKVIEEVKEVTKQEELQQRVLEEEQSQIEGTRQLAEGGNDLNFEIEGTTSEAANGSQKIAGKKI